MAEAKPLSLITVVVLVAVLFVGAGVGTGLLYEYNHPKATPAIRVVEIGDNVTVNYIGYFGSGPQLGRVFDTSIASVAFNNASYPKSLEFSLHAYNPLGVHVGPSAPSGGYSIGNQTFGTVVPGFWQGLLNLPANKTSTIVIPPALGYGVANPACFVTVPLVKTVPVLATLSRANFTQAYPGTNASAGVEFTDPTYGWSDLILSTNATSVVLESLASVGWSVPASPWPVVVTSVNSTSITLANQLTPVDDGLVLGHSSSKVCNQGQFIVTNIDLGAGTYVENYNPEVTGQTLVFSVTVVQFY